MPADGNAWKATPLKEGVPLDFKNQDAAFKEGKDKGLWVLPIVGYALQGHGYAAKSQLANELNMHGPPRDDDEFVNTWKAIVEHYPEIQTYEFWNEPWIFGWTWAATPAEYRALQKQWCEMALKVNPKLHLIVGNSSMFSEDNIEHDPACWKGLITGTTHHPYGYGTGQPSFRAADQFRSMDYGMQITRRMGLTDYYLTEGGTEYHMPPPAELVEVEAQLREVKRNLEPFKTDEDKKKEEYETLQKQQTALDADLKALKANLPDPSNNVENAFKIVQYYVRQALVGGFQGNNQWGIGYGPTWTRSNVAIGVMTYFLEDRPVVADIWPANELLTGAVFANPKHVTEAVKKLPRAAELTARWRVPVPESRGDDPTKVAVVFANTGSGEFDLDRKGLLTIDDPDGDLRAFDLSGRALPAKDGKLALPLGSCPVYVITDKLGVVELRERVGAAKITKITPVNFYAMPLQLPADQAQKLVVRVQNQLNVDAELKVIVADAAGKELGTASATVSAAGLIDVPVTWPGVAVSPTNQYGVRLAVGVRGGGTTFTKQARNQIIAVACFAKKTVKVDGDLADWEGVTPVVLDSDMLRRGLDLTQYLLNPGLEKPTGTPDRARIVAKAYAAYDDQNVYLAWTVNEDKFECRAGTPALKGRGKDQKELPFRNGMPDGLNYICNQGDAIQFGFGFRDRVPGFGRQMDDPYAWKGHFYDTDYAYVAHASTDGDLLMRHWRPEGPRRNGYQCEPVPGMEPVKGGQIKIKRDEEKKTTVYELAIPRAELKLFDPAKGSLRFHFLVCNGEGLGELNLAEAAGVFDYWRNLGSLPPTWMQRLPCQVIWGIEP